MLSKNKIKYINSLRIKKFRDERKQFIVEGDKLTRELIFSDYNVNCVIATTDWISRFPGDLQKAVEEVIEVNFDDLKKVTLQKTPGGVMALVDIPEHPVIPDLSKNLSIVLDDIQDPGNFGTIIRTADWFGIEHIICSKNSVDMYNPKVIQSSMGAICRVRIHYEELKPFLKKIKHLGDIPVFGTFLEGNNIYKQNLPSTGLIIFGNEGNGISENLKPLIQNKIHIPNYPKGRKTSESLNIASSVAIVCSEFRK